MGLPPRATPAPAASLPRAVRPTTAQRGRLAVGRSTHVAAPAAGAAGLAAGLGAGAASEPAPPPEPRPLTPPPLSSFTLSDMVRWLCEWVRLFQKNQKFESFLKFFHTSSIHLFTPSHALYATRVRSQRAHPLPCHLIPPPRTAFTTVIVTPCKTRVSCAQVVGILAVGSVGAALQESQ